MPTLISIEMDDGQWKSQALLLEKASQEEQAKGNRHMADQYKMMANWIWIKINDFQDMHLADLSERYGFEK